VSFGSNYWQLVKLDSAGRRRVEIMTSAKNYLYEQFPNWMEQAEVPDTTIQRELWQRFQSGEALAELCLRCFISYQVDQACRNLSLKFGNRNGFTYSDLLPFVLDDDGRSQKPDVRSLWKTILHSFDPAKAALGTWVSLQVKQHSELKRFLLEHGVYIASDWAILNDTRAKQLQQILSEGYQFLEPEVQYNVELLQSFHAVYREDRLKQKLSGARQLCQPPTTEQLNRIASELYDRTQKRVNPEVILNQLNAIASKLRRVRILARGGAVEAVSLDQPEMRPIVDQIQSPCEEDEILDFLRFYQAQFLISLDRAIAQVIPTVLETLQRKRKPEEAFLTALHLFHCQGQSMSEIAPQVGLKKQYEVTRLLKLADLRADIRQRSLSDLRSLVIDKAKLYAAVDRLQQLEQKVDSILDEQLSSVIEEAESEAQSPIRNQPFRSLLARRLCHYLASRKSSYV
jgi:hypothetical protein